MQTMFLSPIGEDQAYAMLPKRGSSGPRYHGNTYQIDRSEYARTQSGAIIRRKEKPMSRRDRIRAKGEPKNRLPLRAPALNRFCQHETR